MIAAIATYHSFRKKYRAVFTSISRVYELMNRMVNETDFDGVQILYTENNGGRPHVGVCLYSSVLYEFTNDNLKSIKDIFQRVQIDLEYADMLLKLERNKHLLIYTPEIAPGLLRDLDMEHGVTCAYWFKVAETTKKYYYARVLSTKKDVKPNIGELQLFANNIKNVFAS